ncbi:hypothetical protein [Bacteroides acidifaciens]|uniref:hypothetical protein n=1 Tax=Bacteroides acidifaciens TaxID=85831 RepID=UPI00242DEB6F|nr:hypothetical protein [Bacteroides acidifaciens]
MNNRMMFYVQTAWIGVIGGCSLWLSRLISDNYWISVPLFLLMWIALSFIGMGLIGLCNPDHRLCAKYGIKIENLPLYQKAFEELVEAEKRGEDTQWIGDELPDKNEWLRYLSYEIEKGLTK